MDEKRCYGCMELLGEEEICPFCGNDNRTPNEGYQLPAGTILKEHYLIGRVLGQGGFGITYLGFDLYLEIPVAIKEYFPNGVASRNSQESLEVLGGAGELGERYRSSKERFLREVKLLARMSDVPEIVHVKNFFLDYHTAYIVMDYIRGMTLRDYVRAQEKHLLLPEVLKILDPVMCALETIHQAGMVHRDVSPDNIMLLENGTAKLLDFGAMRDVGFTAPGQLITQSTEALLKQGYAPVEQYQGKGSLGPWTDVYAMCATMYYCLTGKVPVDAPSRVLDEEIQWFEELGIPVPQGLEAILKEGMAIRSQERIPDMRTLRERLREIKSDTENNDKKETDTHFGEGNSSDKTESDRKDSGRLPKWLAAVATFAVAATAGGMLWNTTHAPTASSIQTEKTDSRLLAANRREANRFDGQTGDPADSQKTGTETETDDASGIEQDGSITWQIEGFPGVIYQLDCSSGVFQIVRKEATYDFDSQTSPGIRYESASDAPWLAYRQFIRKLIIPTGLRRIGNQSFQGCSSLSDIEGLEYLEEIGYAAFSGAGLTSIRLGDTFRRLEGYAFENCSLKRVFFPASVASVSMSAFTGNPIERLTFAGDPFLVDELPRELEGIIIAGPSGGNVEQYCRQHQIAFESTGALAK